MCERCIVEYNNSRCVTETMVKKVKEQDEIYDETVEAEQNTKRSSFRSEKKKRKDDKLEEITLLLNDPISKRCLEASLEIGASNWLTTLPIKRLGFLLDKQSFWDSLYIRYNIPLKRLVYVAHPSNWIMLYLARKVDLYLSDTTN